MKRKFEKILIALFLFLFALPVFSEPIVETPLPADESKLIECDITFDWISKTQIQRDENIAQIQKTLFNNKTILKYQKKEFKSKYSQYMKDKESTQHYLDVSSGKKEDSDHYSAGFFLKNGLLIAYGVQYKSNLKYIYYYDAMGNLRFIDIYSDSYPKYPYYALQYDMSGALIGTIYFVSKDDQYIFNPNKSFKGRWYKEKMFNKNAKVIMTRSNW